jgi:hypothetical protein
VNKQLFLGALVLLGLIQPAHSNPVSRRATITGVGGNGRCTVEVTVDHGAELEISGDMGLLTTTAGQPADWRRFQCNAPMPRKPVDFRFVRVAGRGTVRLTQDPGSTGGRAVIQITDPQGGRGGYTFDLQWGGPGGGGGGWTPGPPSPPPGPGQGPWPGPGHGPGEFPTAGPTQICQDSVTDRLSRDGYSYVAFGRTIHDRNPGRRVRVSGTASAKRGWRDARFSFSCSVDSSSGTVHFVDVRRR